MAKTAGFWYQRGEALEYKNTGDTLIEAGTIITIGERIGIAESGSGNGYVAADAEAADSTVLVKINA